MNSSSGLASIDIAPLFGADPNSRAAVAAAIGQAARRDGFFYVTPAMVSDRTRSLGLTPRRAPSSPCRRPRRLPRSPWRGRRCGLAGLVPPRRRADLGRAGPEGRGLFRRGPAGGRPARSRRPPDARRQSVASSPGRTALRGRDLCGGGDARGRGFDAEGRFTGPGPARRTFRPSLSSQTHRAVPDFPLSACASHWLGRGRAHRLWPAHPDGPGPSRVACRCGPTKGGSMRRRSPKLWSAMSATCWSGSAAVGSSLRRIGW